ncbi:hypothetical protein LSAT2_032440, partial [Lamellibrachia satsuma]
PRQYFLPQRQGQTNTLYPNGRATPVLCSPTAAHRQYFVRQRQGLGSIMNPNCRALTLL